MDKLTEIWWEGSSKQELRLFPREVVHDMGYQLHLLQTGQMPDDWKPLKNLGKGVSGVFEIRLFNDGNAYRTAYVTKFGDVITVLHCWQKTTRTTTQADKQLIVKRYRSAQEKLL